MSVTKNCKKCGHRISIREMPNGHWIPFNYGTDTLHKCRKISTPKFNGKTTNDNLPQQNEDVIMETLNDAIANKKVLRIACYLLSDKNRWTIRRIVPHKINENNGELFIDCYSYFGKEYREYNLARIRYAEIITDKPYVPPKPPNNQRINPQQVPSVVPESQKSTPPELISPQTTKLYINWSAIMIFVALFILCIWIITAKRLSFN